MSARMWGWKSPFFLLFRAVFKENVFTEVLIFLGGPLNSYCTDEETKLIINKSTEKQ